MNINLHISEAEFLNIPQPILDKALYWYKNIAKMYRSKKDETYIKFDYNSTL